MMTARNLLCLLLISGLASCGVVRNGLGRVGIGTGAARERVEIAGVRYRARVSSDKSDRRAMTITVTPAAPDTAAALEAGRYEATKYCLRAYGGSDTEWTVGPDQPPDQVVIVDGGLTLRGRCVQR